MSILPYIKSQMLIDMVTCKALFMLLVGVFGNIEDIK